MTDTTPLPFLPTINEATPAPDFLEELMRSRHLKMLFWRFGEAQAIDPDGEQMIADLEVVFSNGKRFYHSVTLLPVDTIYGLVGQDGIYAATAEGAVDEILSNAKELPAHAIHAYHGNEDYAAAISTWQHSDGDLIRRAVFSGAIKEEYAPVFNALAELVDDLPEGLSFTEPLMQVASTATQVAWSRL